MTKQQQEQYYSTAGNIGNILLLSLTSLVSACMLNQWPSQASFDSNWLKNGFCISNEDTFWWNSHVLSFYADTAFAAVIAYLYYIQAEVPPIQKALLSGAIMGVLGHGLGHLNLGIDPSGMDLRLRPDDISESARNTLMTVLGFASIFKGTMPLASLQKLLFTAMVATIGFTIFDIGPKLNFVYAQAIIYITNTIHMLFLPKEHKNTAAYMLFPYLNLPVLVVGMIESTGCQAILESIGGHAIYDSTIAIGIIMIEVMSNHIQASKQKTL